MMESLMQNPYAWGVLSLFTISSLIFSVYTWVVGRKTKEISIDYFTNDIIKFGKNPVPQLDIKFDNKTIQDLSSTIFYIWNSGNDVINGEDMIAHGILKIKCDGDHILDAQVIQQSYESNNFSILTLSATSIEIAFDYMDCGEGVKIQVLHTGMGSKLSLDCKIKGGKLIRDCSDSKQTNGIRGFWNGCVNEVFPMIIFLFGMYLSPLILGFFGIQYKEHEILVSIITIVVTIVLIFFYILAKKKYRQIFFRTIPKTLKNNN